MSLISIIKLDIRKDEKTACQSPLINHSDTKVQKILLIPIYKQIDYRCKEHEPAQIHTQRKEAPNSFEASSYSIKDTVSSHSDTTPYPKGGT